MIDGKFYQTFPTLHILKCIYFESRLFDDNEKNENYENASDRNQWSDIFASKPEGPDWTWLIV